MQQSSSVVGHRVADFAFFKGHFPVGDLEPDANSGEAEDQASEPASQPDPDDGQDREPLPLHLGQRVAVEILVALERGRIEPGQVPAPVPERGGDRAREPVVRDVKG